MEQMDTQRVKRGDDISITALEAGLYANNIAALCVEQDLDVSFCGCFPRKMEEWENIPYVEYRPILLVSIGKALVYRGIVEGDTRPEFDEVVEWITSNSYTIKRVVDTTTFEIDLGTSKVLHSYDGGGIVIKSSNSYPVKHIVNKCIFSIDIGKTHIAHSYVSGGEITKINGDKLTVGSAQYSNTTGLVKIMTSEDHDLKPFEYVTLQGLNYTCSMGTKTYPKDDSMLNVLVAPYNNKTGIVTITTSTVHGLNKNDTVTLQGLHYTCSMGRKTYPKGDNDI